MILLSVSIEASSPPLTIPSTVCHVLLFSWLQLSRLLPPNLLLPYSPKMNSLLCAQPPSPTPTHHTMLNGNHDYGMSATPHVLRASQGRLSLKTDGTIIYVALLARPKPDHG